MDRERLVICRFKRIASQTRGGGGEERGSVCGVNEGARGGASSNGGGDWCPRVWNLGFRDLLDF